MEEAKLFKNGQSQAVRLPQKYRFEGDSVAIRKIGEAVVLQPKKSWETLFNSLGQFSQDFMSERKQPPLQAREDL